MHTPMLICLLATLPLHVGAQNPTGRWTLEFWMDSAGAIGPRPTARYVRGQIGFDTLHADTGTASSGERWTRQYWPGRFAVDLRPFFGRQIGHDVSTTVVTPFDRTSSTEVETDYSKKDSIEVNFIPRVSHGGITANGSFYGDTIVGTWYMRAYCCGATGHFRMTRLSDAALSFSRPAPPPLPPPLPIDRRVEVHVRVRDSGTGQFFAAQHSLIRFNPSSSTCCYSTGTQADGWGVYFWLPPGRYQIELSTFDCKGRFASLRKPVVHEFTAAGGDTVAVTLEVSRDTVALSPTYDNRDGLRCRDLRAP